MTLTAITKIAEIIARDAGESLRKNFSTLHRRQIHHKARTDIVTDLDLRTNRQIVRALRRAFPTHGIIAEEGDNHPTSDGYTWLVDPLDGSGNFAAHIPAFAVSLALTVNGVPILGVIVAPELNQLFRGVVGQGAVCNKKRLKVSRTSTLRQAVVSVSAGYDGPTRPTAKTLLKKLQPRVQLVRNNGAVALDLASVAAGWTDAAIKCGPIHAWDVAAGIVIARESGAEVTDLRNDFYSPGSPNLLVTTPALQRKLVAAIKA